jgi:cytochrome c oxidase subunit 3
MGEATLTHEFQYSSARHQAETAIAGMWLFLATEALFFGPLFLAWIYSRHWNTAGFDAGAAQTDLRIGTINTVLLVGSSFAYSVGLAFIREERRRMMVVCFVIAWLLGAAFMVLKFGVEWPTDFSKGLFPGAEFAIGGPLRDGAQLFFIFYFFSTAIHGLHLFVGLILLGWILFFARRFDGARHTPVAIIGLYWSFVDVVWIILYPLIYLIGRGI